MSAPLGNSNAFKKVKRSAKLEVRLTVEDKALFKGLAKAEGLSLSEWVVNRLKSS